MDRRAAPLLVIAIGTVPSAAVHALAARLIALAVFEAGFGRRLHPWLCSTRFRGFPAVLRYDGAAIDASCGICVASFRG
jgi:hypothetical protein